MNLSIKERFFVVILYVAILSGIGYFLRQDLHFYIETDDPLNAVLIVTALSLILSNYITEPFFTKPVDVLTRWIAVFLFLIGLDSKECLLLNQYWIITALGFIVIALAVILLNGIQRIQGVQRGVVDVICKISRPDIVFGLLYFDLVISFFRLHPVEFPLLMVFGGILVINKPIHFFVVWVSRLISRFRSPLNTTTYVGTVLGYESVYFYKVEVTGESLDLLQSFKGSIVSLENDSKGILGIVIFEELLLGKKWLQIASLQDDQHNLLCIDLSDLKPVSNQKTVFLKPLSINLIDSTSLPQETDLLIKANRIYKDRDKLVGYVIGGSTISQVRFHALFDVEMMENLKIGEGTILSTSIGSQTVLYQMIEGKTVIESLQNFDSKGYTVGIAQKLGKYEETENELNAVKWIPNVYSPLYILETNTANAYDPKRFIGRLPNTNYGIPIKLPNELITHNTAILGILGIGKSRLTFELLQKIIDETPVKIICIDLTNQYQKELTKYINSELIQNEIPQTSLDDLRSKRKEGTEKDLNSWGNEADYKGMLKTELDNFFNSTKRVILLNPDLHPASKAGSNYNITHQVDLSPSEKTRLISERIFLRARDEGESDEAKYLLVFEEAHSLVPEWNSVANDGDKNATNGIAKVILQGRKYGLGSMVITQRTANISKSILNQCNTIFALRVFDDTGKQFLENYIGSEYSGLLSTLEERHCVAIGKSMKLKQPVVLQLNDMKDVILPLPAQAQP